MKRTTSIHIKGINFIVEEDAYETLQNYMNRLSQKLAHTEGKEEIIEDIELRIAELFTSELHGTKAVIEQKDVEKAISLLGEPEQYIDEEDKASETRANESRGSGENRGESESKEKKLYRDTENATIAGVCAGLSAYLNIDLIIVRIIFILLLIGGGFGFPLYIILWIVLPTANSHIDRLRMRGVPITVETVREEVEMAAQRLTKSSKNLEKSIIGKNGINKGINAIGRIISKIIGFFLLAFGLIVSIFFVVVFVLKKGVVPVNDENGMLSPFEFGSLVFESHHLNLLWWVGGSMLLIFIIYLVATAMRFILNIRYPWYKYLSRFTILALVITVIVGFYIGTSMAKEFSVDSEVKSEIATTNTPFEIKYETIQDFAHGDKSVRSRNNSELSLRKGFIFHEGFRVRLRESMDSSFHIHHIRSANGVSNRISSKKAKNIRFNPKFSDNVLLVPNYYSYPIKDKIRAQRIRLVIDIPKGKSVRFEGEDYEADEDSYEIWIPSKEWDEEDWDY
jgi:phage shock protein PspC (stress-responsive transcriptional regulator)